MAPLTVSVRTGGAPVPDAAVLAIAAGENEVLAEARADQTGRVSFDVPGDAWILARAEGPTVAGCATSRAAGPHVDLDLAAAAALWPVTIALETADGRDIPPLRLTLTPASAPHVPVPLRRWLLWHEGGRLTAFVERPLDGVTATVKLQEPEWLVAAEGEATAALSPRGRTTWVTIAARLADMTPLRGDLTGFRVPVRGATELVLVVEARPA